MIDEGTDISQLCQMIIFIQFLTEKGDVDVKFLSIHNLLEDFDSANADAIFSTIKDVLKSHGIDIRNCTGFSSDGAAVMVGKNNGVGKKLREVTRCICIHCVCHRLALACCKAVSEMKRVKSTENVLRQVWQWLENSPKRMAAFLKIQVQVKKMRQLSEKGEKLMVRRLKKACSTRWLSFDASVDAVKKEYESIMQLLRLFSDDAAACGLCHKMGTPDFVITIFVLHEVLPILSKLSRTFQGNVNFTMIRSKVETAKEELLKLEAELCKEDSTFLSEIKNFMEKLEMNMNTQSERNMYSFVHKYIEALTKSLEDRFGDSQALLGSLGIIFNPESTEPATVEPHLRAVAKYFFTVTGEEPPANLGGSEEELIAEWNLFKFKLTEIKELMPMDTVNPTFWLLQHLAKQSQTYKPFFPCILKLVSVALTTPMSNAWPERGFSAMKLVKNRLRSRLGSDMLNACLGDMINGPKVSESKSLIKASVKNWLSTPRRKLPPVQGKKCRKAVAEDTDAAQSQNEGQ